MWDLIVLIPDHCLSVYFRKAAWSSAGNELTFMIFACVVLLCMPSLFSLPPPPPPPQPPHLVFTATSSVPYSCILIFFTEIFSGFNKILHKPSFFCVSSKLYVSFALLLLQHESRLLTPSSHLRYQKCIAVCRVSLPYLCFRNLAVFIYRLQAAYKALTRYNCILANALLLQYFSITNFII